MQTSLLKVKTKVKWEEEGENSTKYFHSIIRQRRKKAYLHRIKNEEGTWVQGKEQMAQAAEAHFSQLFSQPVEDKEFSILKRIEKSITTEYNELLIKIPTITEIKEAVWSLDPTSAARPDGFNGSFYQSCWDIIVVDLCNMVYQFFGGSNLTKFYTHTCLVLLPKVESPSNFSQLRPISLSNFSNKIISRILTSRMTGLLPRLVSENQTGFIKGRLITENILLTQEIVQGINKRNLGGNIVIKLDMSKAYDRLSWSFLFAVLSSMGFRETSLL